MAVPTQCQRGIWELPAAALRDWHCAPPCRRAQPVVPRCPPSPTTGGGAAWLGDPLLPASKVRWPSWRMLACQLLRPPQQGGSTLGHPRVPHGMHFWQQGGWVQVPAVLSCGCRLGRGQRWHVLTQGCTVWGRMGWVPGRWGQVPDAALLSLCTPPMGPGAWFGAELPVGLTLLCTCRVLGLYLQGGWGLATSTQGR